MAAWHQPGGAGAHKSGVIGGNIIMAAASAAASRKAKVCWHRRSSRRHGSGIISNIWHGNINSKIWRQHQKGAAALLSIRNKRNAVVVRGAAWHGENDACSMALAYRMSRISMSGVNAARNVGAAAALAASNKQYVAAAGSSMAARHARENGVTYNINKARWIRINGIGMASAAWHVNNGNDSNNYQRKIKDVVVASKAAKAKSEETGEMKAWQQTATII